MDRSELKAKKSARVSSQRKLHSSTRSKGVKAWARFNDWRKETTAKLLALPMMLALLGAILGIVLQKSLAFPTAIVLGVCTFGACFSIFGSKKGFHLLLLRYTSAISWVAMAAALFQLELQSQPIDTLKDHASTQWKPLVIEGVVREPLRYRPQATRQAPGDVSTGHASPSPTGSGPTGPRPAGNQGERGLVASNQARANDMMASRISQVQWTTLVGLKVSRIVNGAESQATHGLVTVAVDGMLDRYLPGDHVRVAGRIQSIGTARNPGEPDYQEWMQQRGEWVRFRAESPEAIDKLEWVDHRFFFQRWLAYMGQIGRQQLAVYLPEPQCSLAAALLLGQREQVGNEINEKLLATGTIHLLSISGLHVEMIAVSLMMLAVICRVPRSVSLWGIGAMVLVYAMVTGSNPPVVRATVLVLGVLAGRWTGRPTSVFNMLGLAGTSLLIYQPSLLFDLGTQLSFLAVFSLVLLSRSEGESASKIETTTAANPRRGTEKEANVNKSRGKLRRLFEEVIRPWFQSVCSMNIGVWLVTTPLVLFHFNIFSPIALLLNVLLWFPVLIAMLSGLALMLLGWLPWLGKCFGFICHWALVSIQALVQWGYEVRGGHVWLPEPSVGWLAIAYVLVLLSLLFGLKQFRWRAAAACIMLLWIFLGSIDGWLGPAGVWGNIMRLRQLSHTEVGELRIIVLDVGHGSAVVLRMPDGTAWLYDAGRLGDQQQVYKTVSQALWNMRVARLDGIILSHADSDHYSGMRGIVKRFPVDRFVTGPRQWEHSSPAIQELYQLLQSRDLELLEWSRGDEVALGEVALKVIHPEEEQRVGSDNARSVCVLLEFAGRRILLPGDLESPGMEQVAELPRLHCDVVMAPHHGSLSGDPRLFLDWCRPPWVLISGSERADSPAVHAVYGAEQREVYLTAREHAIEVRISADGDVSLWHWSETAWRLIREMPSGE